MQRVKWSAWSGGIRKCCVSARAWQDRGRITEGRARMIVLEHETRWCSGNYIILVTWALNIKGIKYKRSEQSGRREVMAF